MEEAAEEERFLWEDISSSLDEVERQEVAVAAREAAAKKLEEELEVKKRKAWKSFHELQEWEAELKAMSANAAAPSRAQP